MQFVNERGLLAGKVMLIGAAYAEAHFAGLRRDALPQEDQLTSELNEYIRYLNDVVRVLCTPALSKRWSLECATEVFTVRNKPHELWTSRDKAVAQFMSTLNFIGAHELAAGMVPKAWTSGGKTTQDLMTVLRNALTTT